MLSSPLLVKCFFGTDLRVLIILYIDVDKGRLTTNYDKTVLVRGGSSLVEITFVGSLVDCTWDKLQYLFWRWCWQKYEEKIQRQKHLGPWGVVVGGDHHNGRETLGGNSTAEKRSQIRMQPYLQQIQFWPRSMGTPGDKFVRNESSRSERSWFSPMTLIKNKCLLESCSQLIVVWYFVFGSIYHFINNALEDKRTTLWDSTW